MFTPSIDCSYSLQIEELSRCFISFQVSFVRRGAKFAAHECARFAVLHGVSSDWIESVPSFSVTRYTD